MSHKTDQINALHDFKRAYNRLMFFWDWRGSNMNDLNAIRHYPFHKSLDELDVNSWVDAMVYELQPKKTCEESGLKAIDVHNLMKILREKRDDIGCVSVHTVDDLYNTLKHLEYAKEIREFYSHAINSLPDMPNDTPEEQKAFDEAWDKFYDFKWVISFGGKTIAIDNEATIYNGITDAIKEFIDECL